MQVLAHDSPAAFLELAAPDLCADVARQQLVLSISETARDQPDVYRAYHAWTVLEGGTLRAAACCTPPRYPVLADARDDAAVSSLAETVLSSGVPVEGVVGNRPTVDRFVELVLRRTGGKSAVLMRQGVFALESVSDLEPVEGSCRPARAADEALVLDWTHAFHREALPEEPQESLSDWVRQRLDERRPQGIVLWEVGGRAVCMSGHSAPVANAVRIGPVYTPPEHRGRGYATALVASQSRSHLAAGRTRCLLYTDLDNPTSNAIYRRIGYRQVAESRVYRLE